MGSIDAPIENGSAPALGGGGKHLSSGNGPLPPAEESAGSQQVSTPENEESRRRKGGVLPLEVGTRVMCRWRDGKYHPVKVIERRRMQNGGPNDYEYYVHYTEFNRRLDEWVKLEQLDLDSVETVVDEKVEDKVTSLKMTRHQKRKLYRLMVRAPQLTHLGTGSFSPSENAAQRDQEPDYASAFHACKSLVDLSGFREIIPDYLPAIYPVCANLTSLNFSYANISTEQLKPVIRHCHKLQNFWVLDSVCDEGLQAVAATCKDLRELRVFPLEAQEDGEGPVSEVGLLAISEGCRKLRSILYFCQRMTNAAVTAMSKNCPDLVVFRLCIMGRHMPDHVTGEPMDEGFGAIVKNCKKLTRLAISGLLTDRVFSYIGEHGKLVRTLSIAFAGDSDLGLRYVLEGCPRLQKLEIRDSPFGDAALRSGLHHYYNMRFLWMSSCWLTLHGCREIAQQMPHLVVEVINQDLGEEMRDDRVNTLYMYRSLEGRRDDAPGFVTIL